MPLWAPSGREVVFSGGSGIYTKAADGTGAEQLLFAREHTSWPLSWSPDGRFLAVTETHPETKWDIWLLASEGDPIPFSVTTANENAAAFSPDGEWIAYQSDQSGQSEIYVQPFPGPGTRVAVSTQGGTEPVWLCLVNSRPRLKSDTYAPLSPRQEERISGLRLRGGKSHTLTLCSMFSYSSSLSAPGRSGRCVGGEPTS